MAISRRARSVHGDWEFNTGGLSADDNFGRGTAPAHSEARDNNATANGLRRTIRYDSRPSGRR